MLVITNLIKVNVIEILTGNQFRKKEICHKVPTKSIFFGFLVWDIN